MTPTREIYLNIHFVWLMYALLLPTLAVFGYGVYSRYRLWAKLGLKLNRLDNPKQRLTRAAKEIISHEKFLRDFPAGLMHAAIFWGMLLLFIGTVVVVVEADLRIQIMHGWFYLIFQKLILNIAGFLVLTGVVVAAIRRYILKVPRLQPNREGVSSDPSDALSLVWLGLLIIQGFALQAIRLAAKFDPYAWWSPVGNLLSLPLQGADSATLIMIYQYTWWFHLLTTFGFIAWLPFSKMIHILTSAASVYTASLEAPGIGTLKPMDFEASERLGISSVIDMHWKDLLDLDACTSCGRCQAVCPAYASGQPLSPRNLILDLRDHLRANGPKLLNKPDKDKADEIPLIIGDLVKEETLWACTTCRACMEECPANIEHVPKIVGMRRHLVMEQSSVPETLQDALRSLEDRVHPYKGCNASRMDWCEDLDIPLASDVSEVDILYWVGCTAAFDTRNQKVARAFALLMKEAGVNFAILGQEESCCGDVDRRTGNEFGYDIIVRANIETLAQYNPKRIVTACPHCFNALGNEYRQFGAEYTVQHHTQFLNELVLEGRLKLDPQTSKAVTFHDPCYLGRYNGEYSAPRDLIKVAGGKILEMENSRSKSFCCGAGGGHAWMEERGTGPRINQLRTNQAIETGANTVVVGCPFCLQMLEDGVKTVSSEEEAQVKDVAELLMEAVIRPGS